MMTSERSVGMRRFVEMEQMQGDNGKMQPFIMDDDSVQLYLEEVEIAFNKNLDDPNYPHGIGSLYITNKRVIWVSTKNSDNRNGDNNNNNNSCSNGSLAFDIDIQYVLLHAISKDPESFTKPCVYCQLDSNDNVDGNEDSDEDDVILNEVFFVPQEESDLMKVFEALSNAALQNPDDEDEDNNDYEGFIYNEEEVRRGAMMYTSGIEDEDFSEENRQKLQKWESVFHVPDEHLIQDENEN